jgi:hypothetical protein
LLAAPVELELCAFAPEAALLELGDDGPASFSFKHA